MLQEVLLLCPLSRERDCVDNIFLQCNNGGVEGGGWRENAEGDEIGG